MHEITPEELAAMYGDRPEVGPIPNQVAKYGIPKDSKFTLSDFDSRGNLLPRNERRAQKRKKKGVKHGTTDH